jgi:hypothetical protein
MNLPSNTEPPLPNPLLHKYVEEREMERREGFMGRVAAGRERGARNRFVHTSLNPS